MRRGEESQGWDSKGREEERRKGRGEGTYIQLEAVEIATPFARTEEGKIL